MTVEEGHLGRAALKGVKSTAFWQVIRLGLLGLSIVVLARLLDPADYGLIALSTAILGIGELLRDMGLSMASIQARHISQQEKTNLFWMNLGIGFALTVIGFVAAYPIAELYDRPELILIVQLMSVSFLFNGIATQFKAQINRDLRFMTLGAIEAAAQAIGLVSAIVFAITIGGYGALIVQALALSLSALILVVLFARWWPGFIAREVSIRRFLSFGGAMAGTQMLAYASKNLDTILLGINLPAAQIGFYNRAYQIVVLPLSQLTAPMTRVAVPILSRAQHEHQRFMQFLRAGQLLGVGAACWIYGTMIGLAVPLVTLILGDAWVAAAPIMQILAISGIFRVLGQVPFWIFTARGFAGAQFRFYLVGQPILIAGIIIAVPYGVIGVSISLAIGYAFFWVGHMLWAAKVTKLPLLSLAISGLVIVVAVAVPVACLGHLSFLLFGTSIVATFVTMLVSLLYVVALVLLVPRYRHQINAVLRMRKKI